MQERQGAEREVQCLLKIGILARGKVFGRDRRHPLKSGSLRSAADRLFDSEHIRRLEPL